MEYLKIDDLATLTGLTKRTIRYYEEIGILPEPNRSEGGTRLYTVEDAEHLKRIMTAKEVLGFSLQELQKFLGISEALESSKVNYRSATDLNEQRESLSQLVQVVNEQLELLDQKLGKIRTVRMELENLKKRAMNRVQQIDTETTQ